MEVILNLIDQLGLTVVITFILAFCTVYYGYSSRGYDYWKKQGVKGDSVWPIIGTMNLNHMFKGFHLIDQQRHKKFGRLCSGFEGRVPVLYVTEPELIKQVMVKDFSSFVDRRIGEGARKDPLFGKMLSVMQGDEWKRTRTILSPTFSSGKIKQMTSLIDDCIKSLIKSLEKVCEENRPTDMKPCFQSFSLDVIASCAFGIKTDSLENPKNEFTTKARLAFQTPEIINYLLVIFPNLFSMLRVPLAYLTGNPFQYLQDFAGQMIDARKEKKMHSRKDFLDLLIEAEQEEGNSAATENTEVTIKKKKTLTRDIMISNSVIFLLAGNDTTATTLTLCTYCLATNPQVQEKLIQEIDSAMSEWKGRLTYEVVTSLQYLDMILSECLRLYPPAIRSERACGTDGYKLGDVILKKDSAVIISIYSLHRDEEFYPNPDIFDPERFSPENNATRNPYTFIPFGVGPRNCIAMRFAFIELKLTIALLLSQFRFTTCEKTEFPVKIVSNGPFSLAPKSVTLVIQKRNDKPNFDL